MNKLLSVSNLRVGFGRNPEANEIVRGVSFDLAAGKRWRLSGKAVPVNL